MPIDPTKDIDLRGYPPSSMQAWSREQDTEMGVFLRKYAGPPPVMDEETRSSIREDTVIREVTRLLAAYPQETITLLDACCGLGALAKRLRGAVPEANRIAFWGVDQSHEYIHAIQSQIEEFSVFADFQVKLRHICDLSDLTLGSVDLIVLNNSLHEIAPYDYPTMFSTFNLLLHPERGQLCIVDMEELPDGEPEAIAITWRGDEVKSFLQAGGFAPEVTTHEKRTTVYLALMGPLVSGVDGVAMKTEIRRLLKIKLTNAVNFRRRMEGAGSIGGTRVRPWLVLTGTIARLAEEIVRFEEDT